MQVSWYGVIDLHVHVLRIPVTLFESKLRNERHIATCKKKNIKQLDYKLDFDFVTYIKMSTLYNTVN